jgi:hypothetical protein
MEIEDSDEEGFEEECEEEEVDYREELICAIEALKKEKKKKKSL